jgi:hypothetical protein
MSNPLKVGLIDGDGRRVEAVLARCELDPSLDVAWTTDCWEPVAELCRRTRPDAVVVDADLDRPPGFDPAAVLAVGPSPISAVLLASDLPCAGIDRLRRLAVYAILMKQDPTSSLLLCLRQYRDGQRSGAIDDRLAQGADGDSGSTRR